MKSPIEPLLRFHAGGESLFHELRKHCCLEKVVGVAQGRLASRINGVGEGGVFFVSIDNNSRLAVCEFVPPVGAVVSLYFVRTSPRENSSCS